MRYDAKKKTLRVAERLSRGEGQPSAGLMSRIRSCGIAMPLNRLICGEKTMSHGGGGNWSGRRPNAMNCMRVPDSSFTMPRVWFLPAGILRSGMTFFVM